MTLTATPSVMDRLPLQLAVMAIDNLVDWDTASSKYAKYSEVGTEPSFRDGEEPQADWVTITANSCETILNARIACWKLYNASHTSVAALLGDRKFRFTKHA